MSTGLVAVSARMHVDLCVSTGLVAVSASMRVCLCMLPCLRPPFTARQRALPCPCKLCA